MPDDSLKLCVLYGSTRVDRVGIRVARYVERFLQGRGHDVTLVDPAEYQLPLLERMYKSYPEGEAPEPLPTLKRLYDAADGYVIVTGEWNHGPPPALVNLLDHFLEEYRHRPASVVSYSLGSFGGVRGITALQPMLIEMGFVPLSTTVPVPHVSDAFDEQAEPADPDAWHRRFARLVDELEWYARALRAARQHGLPGE